MYLQKEYRIQCLRIRFLDKNFDKKITLQIKYIYLKSVICSQKNQTCNFLQYCGLEPELRNKTSLFKKNYPNFTEYCTHHNKPKSSYKYVVL